MYNYSSCMIILYHVWSMFIMAFIMIRSLYASRSYLDHWKPHITQFAVSKNCVIIRFTYLTRDASASKNGQTNKQTFYWCQCTYISRRQSYTGESYLRRRFMFWECLPPYFNIEMLKPSYHWYKERVLATFLDLLITEACNW